jgi:ABC-type nitrate/sulfonate/bicarbonate transport system permease component
MRYFSRATSAIVGVLVWLSIKYGFDVPDRYLPGVGAILRAVNDIGQDWVAHTFATVSRTVIGFVLGVGAGVTLALVLFRIKALAWVMPTVHAVRAVPSVAIVPFFLLWFGFSETGRYLLVVLGLGLNVLVACADTLESPHEADVVLFRNLRAPMNTRVLRYWLPRVLEGLLPTLRFGIALALGVVIVSEMLGAQTGLGYLMQTSRATFSLNVILVCAMLLGVLATFLDYSLRFIWHQVVTWRT